MKRHITPLAAVGVPAALLLVLPSAGRVQTLPGRDPAADAVAAAQVYRKFWECAARGQYIQSWQLLGRKAQARFPLPAWKRMSAQTAREYVKTTRVLEAKAVPGSVTATDALVTVRLEGIITPAEARLLRKVGHGNAKPGLWRFSPNTHRAVREGGQWRVYFLDKSVEGRTWKLIPLPRPPSGRSR